MFQVLKALRRKDNSSFSSTCFTYLCKLMLILTEFKMFYALQGELI